ncbi:Rho GTPase activating protein [Rhizina undulata]
MSQQQHRPQTASRLEASGRGFPDRNARDRSPVFLENNSLNLHGRSSATPQQHHNQQSSQLYSPNAPSKTSCAPPQINLPPAAVSSEARTTFVHQHQGLPASPRPRRDREQSEQQHDGLETAARAGPRPSLSPNPPNSAGSNNYYPPLPTTPQSASQDKLNRLEAEAASIVGEFSGAPLRSSSPQRFESGHPPPKKCPPPLSRSLSLSASSSRSTHAPSRDRLKSLHPVPELQITKASNSNISLKMASAGVGRNMPRTSSIDSAISSASAQTGLVHSSSEGRLPLPNVQGTSPADVQQLIEAAGSAEVLIQYMLKDKASAAAQNSQLWRLVDKQRTMILGLNKDLERALKDKERYRKKLKEHLDMVPALPALPDVLSEREVGSPAPSLDDSGRFSPQNSHLASGMMRSESMPLPERERQGSTSTLEIPLTSHSIAPQRLRRTESPTAQVEGNGVETERSTTSLGSQDSNQSLRSAQVLNKSSRDDATSSSTEEERSLKVDVEFSGSSRPLTPGSPTPISPDEQINRAPPKPLIARMKKLGISTAVAPVTGLGKSPLRKAPPAPLELSPPTESWIDDDDEDGDDDMSIDEIVGFARNKHTAEGLAIVTSTNYDSDNSWQPTPDDLKAVVNIPTPLLSKAPFVLPPSRPAPSPLPVQNKLLTTTPAHSPPTNSLLAPVEQVKSAVSPGFKKQYVRASLPSPGLPSSPRPIDRPIGSPLPRGMTRDRAVSPEAPGSPKFMLPPGTPRSSLPISVSMPLQSPQTFFAGGHARNSSTSSLPSGNQKANSGGSRQPLLIQPSAIPSVDSRVVSSRMRPSRLSVMPGKPRTSIEDSVFTLGVFSRVTGKELLRVEKDVCALPALDAKLRKTISFNVRVPDRALFTGHAPARVDARRAAIDEYFAGVLGATMDEQAALALCEFFSVDVVEHNSGSDSGSIKDSSSVHTPGSGGKVSKEGYLTKRGKNFGGWKVRYFKLDGPSLNYYEAPGGAQLGQIKLQHAQIGRQSQNQKAKETAEGEADTESQYRHAFLVLEPKRKDSSALVRHVLCAENDQERDEWVDALMQYVEKTDHSEESQNANSHTQSPQTPGGREEKRKRYGMKKKESQSETVGSLQAMSYEETTPGAAPNRGPSPEESSRQRATPSPHNSSTISLSASQASVSMTSPSPVPDRPVPERPVTERPVPDRSHSHPKPQISGPTNGSVIQDLAAWGAKLAGAPHMEDKKAQDERKSQKKRSIWGFRQRSSSDLTPPQLNYGFGPEKLSRAVFGATLEEAVHLSRPAGIEAHLPAVVYRCIEYLDFKDAANEEGIFRLSGSNVVIKGLRERFNTESDFNLLANDEYYDVHAIAGLLKLYLRELPTNILTTERREDFVKVTEMDDKSKKITALNNLVHSLPIENFCLLKALSRHLLKIVDNSDVNKMTIRNVGIVFSPTLNIPAQVFSMFLHEYHEIFFRSSEDGGREEERDSQIPQGQQQQMPPNPASPPPSERKPSLTTPGDRRPSLTTPEGRRPSLTPRTPMSPPPLFQQLPQTPVVASYEPSYEQHFVPGPMSVHEPSKLQENNARESSGLLVPVDPKANKARRRESSMMFMMGGMGRKNPLVGRSGPASAMVMEDSVYE